jgi:hypothetical protein
MSLALPRPILATRRSRTVAYGVTVGAAAVGGALLTTAEPTGLPGADMFWSAALVAVLATFGATARRWTWFLPAGIGALLAGDAVAIACAGVAIAIAFVSVVRNTRTRARGALVSALGGIALLRAGPLGFHGLTAVLTFAAVAPAIVSGYQHAGRSVRHRARRIGIVCGSIVGLMVAGAALGLFSVVGELMEGARHIDGGLEAARSADDELAAEELDHAARSLSSADSTLTSWFVSPARSLPVIGPNLEAVGALANESSRVARVSAAAAADADVDTLRFTGGRLDPAAVAAMEGPLNAVVNALESFDSEVLDDRSPWLAAMVSSRLDQLGEQVDEALPEAQHALSAVRLGPTLLGAEAPQRYLVLFTSPVEARGRIGFPGNYAELLLVDGKMSMPVFGRISELEQGGGNRTLSEPADLVARYSRFDVANTWRNLTMTPDFRSLAAAAYELYPQSTGKQIDGVINVDPTGLAQILRMTGNAPIQVAGLDKQLTADNVADYIMREQYEIFEFDNDARVEVLDKVARTTFDRLTSADLAGPRTLSELLDPMVDAGHIMFSPKDVEALLVTATYGVDGGLLPTPPGNDLVAVTTTNGGANKIDLYLERSHRYDVTWNPETGQIEATLQVTLENRAPVDGLPDYVIGNSVDLPPGTNRSFVSLYTPFALDEARIDGEASALQSEVELERNVYSTFIDIAPGGSRTIEIDVSGAIEGRRYELDLPSAPFGTVDELDLTVTVVGADAVSVDADVDGSVATWSGPLDVTRRIDVSAPRG